MSEQWEEDVDKFHNFNEVLYSVFQFSQLQRFYNW